MQDVKTMGKVVQKLPQKHRGGSNLQQKLWAAFVIAEREDAKSSQMSQGLASFPRHNHPGTN